MLDPEMHANPLVDGRGIARKVNYVTDYLEIALGHPVLALQNTLDSFIESGNIAWRNLGQGLQEAVRNALDTLWELSETYPEIDDSQPIPKNHIDTISIGNPARRLIEWFSLLIFSTDVVPMSYTNDLWVKLVAETNILDFVEKKRTELACPIENVMPDAHPFTTFSYRSDGVSQHDFDLVYEAYQNIFDVNSDLISQNRHLFLPHSNTQRRMSHISLRESGYHWYLAMYRSDNLNLSDPELIYAIKESLTMNYFVVLDDKDFAEVFDPAVIATWGDRFWVNDATNLNALVITPNGLRNLCALPGALESNAKHEFYHFYANKYLSMDEDGMFSGQYILPKWFVEGMANVYAERGREEDGFRTRQLKKLKTDGYKSADEIIAGEDLDYLYPTQLVYFIVSILRSSRLKDVKGFFLLPKGRLEDTFIVMKHLRRALYKETIPTGPMKQHKLFENMVNSVLRDAPNSEEYRNMDFEYILRLFDHYREQIMEAYYNSDGNFVNLPFVDCAQEDDESA
jgi:hypothetical protein